MRVLWFAPCPLSPLGPLPVPHEDLRSEHPVPWVMNLSKAIIENKLGVDLHIATVSPLVSKSFTIVREGITYHVCKTGFRIPVINKHWPLYEWRVWTKFYEQRKKLCRIASQIRPDIVHAFGTEASYALAAADTRRPHIIFIQGIIQQLALAFPENRSFRIRIPIERKAMQRCRFYTVETAFAENFVKARVEGSRTWRIGNSVRPLFFNVPPKEQVFHKLLFAGSLLENKGIRELLVVIAQQGRSVTLAGMHAGEFARNLKREYANNKNINWAGECSHEQIAEMMKTHDALVLPSYMDTSPNVVAEAMAAGLPVVATRVGGIPDMVRDGESGILVEPKSVESLAWGIQRLYSDTEKMMEMGRVSRRIAEKNFRPEENARIIIGAYREILKRPHEPLRAL